MYILASLPFYSCLVTFRVVSIKRGTIGYLTSGSRHWTVSQYSGTEIGFSTLLTSESHPETLKLYAVRRRDDRSSYIKLKSWTPRFSGLYL